MDGVSLNMRCDWCGGELEFVNDYIRCRECWRAHGKERPVFWKRDKDGKRIPI